ncbi:hypothetical protein [Phenylobacterium sp.]|uniref:hypothetical protein n=1 Tax=Phenylobacterium sp. TaxID=1871053 RepID=UPI00301BFA48
MALRFLLAILLLLAAPAAAVAQYGPGVPAVVDKARSAMGGSAAWAGVRGFHETGAEGGQPYQRWIDTLRYGERTEVGTGPQQFVQGYNGYGAWWQPFGRARPPGSDAELMARARSEAFFGAYGYLFPGRFDFRSTYLGVRPSGGKSFDVVRVHPEAGAPREVWFDRATGLPGRMVEGRGGETLTLEFGDYRRVGRLMLPFLVTATGAGRPKPVERRLEKIEAVTPDRALFSLPR